MTQLMRRAGSNHGDMLATQDGNRKQTWREFSTKVAKFAAGLQTLGIKENSCAAILALNSDRYLEFMFAVPWAGGLFQPINTRLAAPEILYWLNDSEASVLLVDQNFLSIVEDIKHQLKHVTAFVYIGNDTPPNGYTHYDDLIDHQAIQDFGRQGHDIAGLFYTGGTTGRSKGVMLSHNNLVVNALQATPLIDCQVADRILHIAPMFHIADAFICITSAINCGSNYFLPAFDPEALMKIVTEEKIQRMLLVPTMVNMLVNHQNIIKYDLSSIRGIVYGASPMPEPVIKKAMNELPHTKFYQAYGQTEAAPAISILGAERHVFEGPLAGKMKSAGQAIPGVDLAIMDETNDIVTAGTVGEICMRGPNIMLGYRNMETQTNNTIIDGWLHTGDGGYLDSDGFLFIVDRVKDMIISGGENVYSAEVESAIYQHPAINQCAVIGIPHETWGEQVHAIVILHEHLELTESELITHCKSHIASFKCPRSITFRDAPLPLSGAGKILKTELRKPYWQEHDKNVG